MTEHALPPIDQRAVRVLFDRYWTASGWRDEASIFTSPEDFQYAKQSGVMFDPVRLTHDQIVERAVTAVKGVERSAVARAFIVSLTSRRLDLRSALGSLACMHHLPRHAAPAGPDICPVCGLYLDIDEEEDLNVLNFERLKWGGVRHDDPLYASLDLTLFQQLPAACPSSSDLSVFHGLIEAIKSAPARTSPASLQKRLSGAFKSNKEEREGVIAILGYCGILATAEHPGYSHHYVAEADREPPRTFDEVPYPACWWRGSEGVNEAALAYWFADVL